jgi:hypothetical protein
MTTLPPETPPGRFLDPGLVAFDHALEHGALVRLRTPAPTVSGGTLSLASSGSPDQPADQVLHFQYNPETITRTRQGSWEARSQRRPGTPSPSERTTRGAQGSGAVNAESEQISLKLVFDATEAILTNKAEAPEKGVLPELAFFEVTTLGKESGAQGGAVGRGRGGGSARAGSQRAQPVRPDELLLVLGASRTFPVVITNLTITEQKWTPELVPIRAEVDLRLTVLEPGESAYAAWISQVFGDLLAQRTANAEVAHGRSALDAVARSLGAPLRREEERRQAAAAGTGRGSA